MTSSLLRSTFRVSLLTLISRATGYVRDMFLAAYLGASVANDIYITMFRVPSLFRTIFGEGAFSTSFIPLYASIKSSKGEGYARQLANFTQQILLFALLSFGTMLYIFMPEFISLTIPRLATASHDPHLLAQTTMLTRITLPYLIFISLASFYGGILNAHGKYSAFAAAPIAMNICLIVSILVSSGNLLTLAWGIFIAGALECLLVWLVAKKHGLNPPLTLHSFKEIKECEEIQSFCKRLMAGVMVAGVMQLNIWIDMMIISVVPGGLSMISYADRVVQLPLALIGTALGTVLTPILAQHHHDQQMRQKHQNIALKWGLLLSMPAACGLLMLPVPIVKFLFERGEFIAATTRRVANVMMLMAWALPPQVMYKIFLSNFYTAGDIKTPVKIMIVSMLINATVALLLIDKHQEGAIAWAVICSSWCSALICVATLYARRLLTIKRDLCLSLCRICFACAAMVLWLWACRLHGEDFSLGKLSFTVVIAAAIYTVICWPLLLSSRQEYASESSGN